jgi:hypothetical protein
MVAASASTLLLTACGDDVAQADWPIVISGTAAGGQAIAGAAVEFRCVVGSATTTTATNGTYEVELAEGAELPCVVRLTQADGSRLHSVIASNESVANITTMTELVVARLGGMSAEEYFDGFEGDEATKLADDDFNFGVIQSAADDVVAIIKAAGVDFGPKVVSSILTGELIAAYDGQTGNKYDQQLDVLGQSLLASNTNLAVLSDEIVRSIPNDAANLSNVASLPAELLLKPAASNCLSLRGGSYRLLALSASVAADVTTEVVTLNAAALTVTRASGAVEQWDAIGECAYTTAVPGEAFVVSPAGLIVARVSVGGGAFASALLFPEQVIRDEDGVATAANIEQLAGSWNAVGLEQTTTGGPVHLVSSTYTLNGAGVVKALTVCDGAITGCTTSPFDQVPNITFSMNAAGGFDVVNATAGRSARAFVYRAGGGHLMLVTLSLDGQLSFATYQVEASLPEVDTVRESWNLALSSGLLVGPSFVDGQSTVISVDDATGQYVREVVLDFGTGLSRPESILINDPRAGYRYRPEATVTDSNGGSSLVTEELALPMQGMGLVTAGGIADSSLTLSVQKPAH